MICLSEDCWLSAIFFRASSSFSAMNLSWKTQGRKIRILRIPVEKLTHLQYIIKTAQECHFHLRSQGEHVKNNLSFFRHVLCS